MSQQIQEVWKRFDELIGKTGDENTKAIIEAIKLQTELINLRLAPLPHEIGAFVARANSK